MSTGTIWFSLYDAATRKTLSVAPTAGREVIIAAMHRTAPQALPTISFSGETTPVTDIVQFDVTDNTTVRRTMAVGRKIADGNETTGLDFAWGAEDAFDFMVCVIEMDAIGSFVAFTQANNGATTHATALDVVLASQPANGTRVGIGGLKRNTTNEPDTPTYTWDNLGGVVQGVTSAGVDMAAGFLDDAVAGVKTDQFGLSAIGTINNRGLSAIVATYDAPAATGTAPTIDSQPGTVTGIYNEAGTYDASARFTGANSYSVAPTTTMFDGDTGVFTWGTSTPAAWENYVVTGHELAGQAGLSTALDPFQLRLNLPVQAEIDHGDLGWATNPEGTLKVDGGHDGPGDGSASWELLTVPSGGTGNAAPGGHIENLSVPAVVGDHTWTWRYMLAGVLSNGSHTETYVTPDTTIPVITLLGDPAPTHQQGQPYTDPGATWADNGNTGAATVTGVIDVNTPGAQSLFYNYTDAGGNAATAVERVVTVAAATLAASGSISPESGYAVTPITSLGEEAAILVATYGVSSGLEFEEVEGRQILSDGMITTTAALPQSGLIRVWDSGNVSATETYTQEAAVTPDAPGGDLNVIYSTTVENYQNQTQFGLVLAPPFDTQLDDVRLVIANPNDDSDFCNFYLTSYDAAGGIADRLVTGIKGASGHTIADGDVVRVYAHTANPVDATSIASIRADLAQEATVAERATTVDLAAARAEIADVDADLIAARAEVTAVASDVTGVKAKTDGIAFDANSRVMSRAVAVADTPELVGDGSLGNEVTIP